MKPTLTLLLLALLIGACSPSADSIATAIAQTQAAAPAPTLVPVTPTSLPTATPDLSPEGKLRELLTTTLSFGNRDVPRLTGFEWSETEKTLTITWAINDNLTTELRTFGFEKDIVDILKALMQSTTHDDYPFELISVHGTFPLVDVYGNVSEEVVVNAGYSFSELQKVKWDNFQVKNVFNIANLSYVHPAMLK